MKTEQFTSADYDTLRSALRKRSELVDFLRTKDSDFVGDFSVSRWEVTALRFSLRIQRNGFDVALLDKEGRLHDYYGQKDKKEAVIAWKHNGRDIVKLIELLIRRFASE